MPDRCCSISVPEQREELWWFDPASWWRADALQRDSRFMRVEHDRSYIDYVATMSAEAAPELNQRFAEHAFPWWQDRANALDEKPPL